MYSTSAAASRRRREKFGVGASSSLNARLPTRAPGLHPHDASKLGGLTHDADATAEYVVGTRQYGSFGAKPGGIAELRSRYASRVLGAATHGHSRSSYAPPEVFVDEDDAAARGTGGGRHHLARLSSNVAANGLGGTMNPMHPGAAARKSLMDRDERIKRTSLSTLAAAAPRAERPMHEPIDATQRDVDVDRGIGRAGSDAGWYGSGRGAHAPGSVEDERGVGAGGSNGPVRFVGETGWRVRGAGPEAGYRRRGSGSRVEIGLSKGRRRNRTRGPEDSSVNNVNSLQSPRFAVASRFPRLTFLNIHRVGSARPEDVRPGVSTRG